MSRNFGKVVCSILLVVSLTALVLSFSIYQFLSYDDIKPIFVSSFIQTIVNKSDMGETELAMFHSMLLQNCTTGAETIDLPLGEDEDVKAEIITLKCSDIKESEPKDIPNLIGNALFDKIYYKQYDCSFFECVKQMQKGKLEPLIFFSSFAHSFFKSLIVLFLVVSLLLITSIFFLNKPHYKFFNNIGICFIIVGLQSFFIKFISTKLPQEDFFSLIIQLINIFYKNFFNILIIGIVLLVLGILFSIFLIKKGKKKKKKIKKKKEKIKKKKEEKK